MTTNIPPIVQAQPDIISPAEAKFWQEWAQKAPVLIRSKGLDVTNKATSYLSFSRNTAVGIGAALGVATLSKFVSGKWKALTGGASGISFVSAVVFNKMRNATLDMHMSSVNALNDLENDPNMRMRLAEYLSNNVTADKIKAHGIENAVLMEAIRFVTPQLNVSTQNINFAR